MTIPDDTYDKAIKELVRRHRVEFEKKFYSTFSRDQRIKGAKAPKWINKKTSQEQ